MPDYSFSERNLNYMIMLAREYERNKLNTGLSYSQYCTLFTISNTNLRRDLEKRAIRENLSYLQLAGPCVAPRGPPLAAASTSLTEGPSLGSSADPAPSRLPGSRGGHC